ncbi:LysR family transcriptional regulator [Mycobacterium sp. E802]|uniref:LysR family transcriptional regulator n=1 Tax=Mycobacterium sp. E802 TaxID=1834152 RepID=UPI000ACCCC8F|nr:LysR family transcriptional regulator [Mycobacterium sp. E802]
MELRQLEHFIAVAGEMSFTRGAERAHVVQSALSSSIAKLERELGVALFDRSRQRISLTAAGEAFRPHALEVLHAARAATESTGKFRGALMGTVEFGSLISYGPVDVARALGDFHRAHPFVRLRLRLSQSGASAYLSALLEGSLDLALVSLPNRFPTGLDMTLLFEEKMVFVCRDDHPLSRRRRLDLADLADEDLVGFPPEFGLDGRRFSPGRGGPQNAVRGAGRVRRDRRTRRQCLGTAFMPASEARRFDDLRTVALRDPATWQVYLAAPRAERMTPAAARLAETLLAAASSG